MWWVLLNYVPVLHLRGSIRSSWRLSSEFMALESTRAHTEWVPRAENICGRSRCGSTGPPLTQRGTSCRPSSCRSRRRRRRRRRRTPSKGGLSVASAAQSCDAAVPLSLGAASDVAGHLFLRYGAFVITTSAIVRFSSNSRIYHTSYSPCLRCTTASFSFAEACKAV